MPWLRWLFVSFGVTFPVLLFAYLLRDRPWQQAVSEALTWGGITAFVFTAAQIRRVRRGKECALCDAIGGEK